MSWDYPEADYRHRAEIREDHINYIKGFFYFLAHDPRVPTDLQREVNAWGWQKMSLPTQRTGHINCISARLGVSWANMS